MPQAALDIVASNPLFDRLPFSVEQKSSRASAVIMLLLLVPAVATLLVPVGLIAAFATPALWAAMERPAAALQVVLGLGVWTVLFVLPAKRILQRFGTARDVRIEQGLVTVREQAAFRSRVWTAPLSDFSGIAHHVRSTLSGVRHELILVHRQRPKSVLLHAGDRIPQSTIESAAALLGMPHVPAGELYRLRAARRTPSTSAPVLAKPLAA
jgi:hypothetical protein